jgi:hypothetical protein
MRTGEFRQLTKNPADDYMPTWSPGRQGNRVRLDA